MFQFERYSGQWVMTLDPAQLVDIAHISIAVATVMVLSVSIYVT